MKYLFLAIFYLIRFFLLLVYLVIERIFKFSILALSILWNFKTDKELIKFLNEYTIVIIIPIIGFIEFEFSSIKDYFLFRNYKK